MGEEAMKAQVCRLARTERVHGTINNDINVCQIKWPVNNLLTALTSELLSGIDQPAVPWLLFWREPLVPPGKNKRRGTPKTLCLLSFSLRVVTRSS